MNETLQIWVGPVLSFLGVLLGFIVNAIFNSIEYKKQIRLLEVKTEKQFIELQKQKALEQGYVLLERTLSSTQEKITEEKNAFTTYARLNLEFERISALAKHIMEKIDSYTDLPKIETNVYSMLMDPSKSPPSVTYVVVDVHVLIEEYNRDELKKEYKKELLEKIDHMTVDGRYYCFEEMKSSSDSMYDYWEEYKNQINAFKKDGSIIMTSQDKTFRLLEPGESSQTKTSRNNH